MPNLFSDQNLVRPGVIYEDGFWHPCLCLGVDEGVAWGVSLIDGSYPRSTDVLLGGIRELNLEEVMNWKSKSEEWRRRNYEDSILEP